MVKRAYLRRGIALGASVALLAAGCSNGTATSASSGRPNVVFVLTDDLSNNLVQYMPHVQALEKAGLAFSDYTVTDSLCCPSRSSIFTGRFPHDTRIFTNGGNASKSGAPTGATLDGGFDLFHARGEEKQTFATALQGAGYRTAMMGKYLNGYQPSATEGTKTAYIPPGWNEWDVAGQGYREFNYDLNQNGHVVHYGSQSQDYLTDVVSGRGSSFIRGAAGEHRPFLLEVATFAPHGPYTPAPRDANAFPGLTAPRGPAFDQLPTNPPSWLAHFQPLTSQNIAKIDEGFRKRAQAVQAVDAMIGHLEDTLKAAGVADNTYLVFSSDNGYHMGEHRLTPGKMTAFDTDIQVPLIVAGPGVAAGRTSDQLTQNIDLAPTFEALGGVTTPANLDGRSLVPLLHGQPTGDWRTASLVEHHGPDVNGKDPDFPAKGSGNPRSYEAIRTATSTYVEYSNGETEYYDLTHDPDELHNTAGQLPASERARLHATLAGLENCHDAANCWAAGHLK
ncbi:MAG: sulfatase [Acidimicrobiales bacterium]|nr:MAG: sulfatase [Acidimicrobiales bacterium]